MAELVDALDLGSSSSRSESSSLSLPTMFGYIRDSVLGSWPLPSASAITLPTGKHLPCPVAVCEFAFIWSPTLNLFRVAKWALAN